MKLKFFKAPKQWTKVDRFVWTYAGLFEHKDSKKLLRSNNIGRLIASILSHPVSLFASFWLPFNITLFGMDAWPFIWKVPIIASSYLILNESATFIYFYSQYRVKKKMYDKYYPAMDLTKEQVEQLEEEEEKLKLEDKSK
ncbi:unnamed protein product [Blepharisma stoltei]|uniref:Uncharacterized protein n=1 Tax=Blepharisma stoltei TaxID=1481888 RepID=A0AAU9JH83_9CILI|nr:unnamed protein product [Blepharisma stoltei]